MSSSSKLSSQCRKVSEDELSDSWVKCEIASDGESSQRLAKEMEKLFRDAQRESGDSSHTSSSEGSKVGSLPTTPFNSPQSTPGASGQVTPNEKTSAAHEVRGQVIPNTKSSGAYEVRGQVTSNDKTSEQQMTSVVEKNAVDDADLVWTWASTPEIQPRKVSYRRPKRKSLNLSFRKTSAMKSGLFSWDFLQIFIPSMILSNIFAFGVGIFIGKRIAQSNVTSL